MCVDKAALAERELLLVLQVLHGNSMLHPARLRPYLTCIETCLPLHAAQHYGVQTCGRTPVSREAHLLQLLFQRCIYLWLHLHRNQHGPDVCIKLIAPQRAQGCPSSANLQQYGPEDTC